MQNRVWWLRACVLDAATAAIPATLPTSALRRQQRHPPRTLCASFCSTSWCTQRRAFTTTTPEENDTTATGNAAAARMSSASASPASSSSSTAQPLPTRKFVYAPRLRYTAPWRSKSITDFLVCRDSCAIAIAHTYRHPTHNITVTLIPLRHFAHPDFFRQVDDLCAQHESVLMEGRMPLTGAPYSTMVPPRPHRSHVRPPEHEDDEGWEPREMERFFQPFSWGVADSPNHTVVHAADKYDYEKLPWWCSVRFNVPVLGSLKREQHCLDMIYPLNDNAYKSFAIPWGVAHMPVFHEMLLDNGFENVGMCSLVVLNRVDGIISEGEFSKMQLWQRRRAGRINVVYGVGIIAFLSFLYSYVSVDYRRGPQMD